MSIQQNIDYHAQSLADKALSARDPQLIQSILGNLTTAIQDGSVKPYVGIPLVQSINQHLQTVSQQADMMNALRQAPQVAPDQTIGAQTLATAEPSSGIDTAQSNLPAQMASGGIVAFDDGGEVESYAKGDYIAPTDYDPVSQYRAARDLATRESLRSKYGISAPDFYGTNVAPIKSPYDAALGYYANRLNPESPQASPEYPAFLELKSRRDAWMQGKPDPFTQQAPVGSVPNLLGTQEPPTTKDTTTTETKPKGKITIHDNKATPATSDTSTQDISDSTGIMAALKDYETALTSAKSDREGLKNLILGDEAQRAKDKKTDMWLEALKASFKMMGGTSPYALANVGPAGEALATGISGVLSRDKEDAQKRIAQQVALGLKGSELDTEAAKLGLTKADVLSKYPYYSALAWKARHPTNAAGLPKGITSNVADQIMERYSAYGQSHKTAKTAPFYNDNISIPQMNDKPLEWTQKDRLFLEDNPDSPGGRKALEKWKKIVQHKQDERLGKLYLLGGRNTAQSALTSDE